MFKKLGLGILVFMFGLVGITSSAGAVTLTLGAGTAVSDGALTLNSTGATALTVAPATAAGTIVIGKTDGTGLITIGASTGAEEVNIATGNAVKTVLIGNATLGGASITTVHAGTGGLNLATTADARTIAIGTGAADQIVNIATGAATGGHTIVIGDATTSTGTTTIHGGSGGIVIGSTADIRTIAIGGGAAVQTINIGMGNVANVINLGSTADTALVGTTSINSDTITLNGALNYALDAVGTDAYVVTLAPAITELAIGQQVFFQANIANTGAATINVNALGVKDIIKRAATVLADGDIPIAPAMAHLVYNGVAWQLMNPTVN